MNMLNRKLTIGYSLVAGTSDTMTGLGLILLPLNTLALMGVDPNLHEISLIRFIGAFVLATGSLYLAGILRLKRLRTWTDLRTIWFCTAWIRTFVAIVTLGMIFKSELSASWLPVPLTDGLLATFQAFWLASRRFPMNES